MRNNQTGFVHFLSLILILAGLLIALFLTQNPQIFRSRAGSEPIVFKDLSGNPLPLNSSGIPYTISPKIKIELTSIYPPGSSGVLGKDTTDEMHGNKKPTPTLTPTLTPTPTLTLTPSPTASPTPQQMTTVSYKLAEDPISLDTASPIPYTSSPTVLDYQLKDQSPGVKTIFVKFIFSDGTISDSHSRQVELVAPPTPTPAALNFDRSNPYGANDWNFTDDGLKAAKDAGVTWVRLQGVLWKSIEPVQGQFNWNSGPTSRVDDYVAQATKYGMKITTPVSITPDWAKQPGLKLPQPDLYANFLKAFLTRYPGKIAAVEVLAEENTGTWPETKNRDAIYYTQILRAAYKAVKAVDPNVLVVTSSLWGTPVGYLEDIYTLGGKGYFDVANFHYYPSKNSPASNYTWLISHYRKVMEKYGDGGKPIWMTEFAWPINDEPMGRRTNDIVSPQQQSDDLTYVLNNSMKSGFIQKVFWYVLTGDDGMAMLHDTDYYDWRTNQPALVSSIGTTDTTLTVSNNTTTKSGTSQKVDWTKAWPQNGILTIENERLAYTSLSASADGSGTVVQGLSRGTDNTTASAHAAGTQAKNQDLTAGFKRQVYNTYKSFIQKNPNWLASQISPLPDVAQPASTPPSLSNSDFEGGITGWNGSLTVDQTQFHAGKASAKVVNTTGAAVRASHKAIPIEPGKSYLLKAWVKIDPAGSGNMDTMVEANMQDASRKYLAGGPSNYYIYDTGGIWREIHYPFRTPDNATQLVVYLSTSGGTGTAWFDDITIEPYDLSTP